MKWYVFDTNCYDCFKTAAEAAAAAEKLRMDDVMGIHIALLSPDQLIHYLAYNDLRAALKV